MSRKDREGEREMEGEGRANECIHIHTYVHASVVGCRYVVRACLPHTLQKTSGLSCGVSGLHAFQTISLSPDASLHLQPQGEGNPLHTLNTYVRMYVRM